MKISKLKKFLTPKNVSILSGVALVALAVLLFTVILPMHQAAKETGTAIGKAEGTVVGMAIGSFKGLTEGLEQGKQDALEHPEVEVFIATRMTELGRLEVLAASVSLKNMHSVGDKYHALYQMKANAVFTVDLQQAVIGKNAAGELTVQLPQPELDLYYDESSTKKLAEDKPLLFDGKAEDGYDAYLNSIKESAGKIREVLSNYDILMNMAQNSAVTQIERLAQSASGSSAAVHVSFLPEEEE